MATDIGDGREDSLRARPAPARLLRWLRVVAVGAALGYVLGGALLTFGQEQLLFPVPAVGPAFLAHAAERVGAERFELVAGDGVRLEAWGTGRGHDRALLVLHGNGGTVADSRLVHAFGEEHGWVVLSISWRGYPGSEGRPSQAGMQRDARALWTHAVEEWGISPDRVVPYGVSLGGSMAIWLAQESPAGALVVDSTFRSMVAMARKTAPIYPVGWLLRHPFPSDVWAARVSEPVFQVHSRDDGLIPVAQARGLATRFARGRYVEVEGYSHNGFSTMRDPLVREQLVAFLEQHVP